MKKITTHTPTPWRNDLHNNILAGDVTVATVWGDNKDKPTKENAAFIVRAVNSHEALLEAVKTAREMLYEAQEGRDANYAHALQIAE